MSQNGQAPVVLAFPLRQARLLLTADHWQVARVLTARDQFGKNRPGEATETASSPSEWEEWRVIRQRTLTPGQVELLVAPEMRPRA